MKERGFTLLEMVFTVGILGVLFVIASPMLTTALDSFRLSGDGRTIADAVAVARMRSAATFSHGRLYVDLNGGTYKVQRYDRPTSTWLDDGLLNVIVTGDSFGYGSIASPPPNTQATIAQSPLCKDNSNNDIANTACVVFNSRGVPIDAAGAPVGTNAIYVRNSSAVYGVTVSATGLGRTWRGNNQATPSWVPQ